MAVLRRASVFGDYEGSGSEFLFSLAIASESACRSMGK